MKTCEALGVQGAVSFLSELTCEKNKRMHCEINR